MKLAQRPAPAEFGPRPAGPLLRALGMASLERRLLGHFHAVRIANAGRVPAAVRPLLFYLNHASCWDAPAALLLHHALVPGRESWVAVDPAELPRPGWPRSGLPQSGLPRSGLPPSGPLRHLGLLPAATAAGEGAEAFLRTATALLGRGALLTMIPQDRPADVRHRPLTLEPLLASLVARLQRVTLVPVAIEYGFWNHPLPEVLLNCGEPLRIADGGAEHPETWNNLFGYALSAALDELAMLAVERNPLEFAPLLGGGPEKAGGRGPWRRLRSAAASLLRPARKK